MAGGQNLGHSGQRAELIGGACSAAAENKAAGLCLGCNVLGIEGGEIMPMLQIAKIGKLPYTVLKEAIVAHATLDGRNNVHRVLDARSRAQLLHDGDR